MGKPASNFQILTVNVFKEQGQYVCQCLEKEIATQGGTKRKAKASFLSVVTGHVVLDLMGGRKPLSRIPKPPKFVLDGLKSVNQERFVFFSHMTKHMGSFFEGVFFK